MAYLEIRRHSHRKTGGGSQLSQRGVDLARQVGGSSGPYDEVVTSVLPRARETAIAMGFAVDSELVTVMTDEDVYAAIGRVDAAIGGQHSSEPSFASLARLLGIGQDRRPTPDQNLLYRWSQTIVGLWRDLMTPYGDSDARVLFIGHSGDLEAGLVSCLPQADHESWGGYFAPLDGALLEFSGEPARFRTAKIIRA